MSDGTKIEWTDATWNPITGCSVHSAGCTNCYAMRMAGTRLKNHPSRAGLTDDSKAGPVWNGQVRFNDAWLDQPVRWQKPRMIFVCAHGDLFHENVPDEWIDKVLAVMAMSPQHTFQVLTKRADRMRDYMASIDSGRLIDWGIAARKAGGSLLPCDDVLRAKLPLRNVWLGVSVEDQKAANERIPLLLSTPAAVRWISAEPLLGLVDLDNIEAGLEFDYECFNSLSLKNWWDTPDAPEVLRSVGGGALIDWVVAGGESGPGARPAKAEWFQALLDQCDMYKVPFLFKQWGSYVPAGQLDADRRMMDPVGTHAHLSKKLAGRLLDGIEHNGYPTHKEGGA